MSGGPVDPRLALLERAGRLAHALEALAQARLLRSTEPTAEDEALWALADALLRLLEQARAPH
ncbi:hypothetical protein G8A07_25175 [Roseateles sp. DAIF2]|uniref:hypothetical protein n=1 Tax=Roseateles sp. DAIF2 TaxID=2714952 RepID=UPI0018A304A5|nr:hypothetical protein [Roseateles sp. DAIF2]QPF75881.1 hypothetical protein G8A07_25175 [Roseateles sp. DAIF2]